MHKDLTAFSAEIPFDDEEKMKAFQQAMDDLQDATNEYVNKLALELGCSVSCAYDVVYLRTRSRWNQEAEEELIKRHKAGNPPPVLAGWPKGNNYDDYDI